MEIGTSPLSTACQNGCDTIVQPLLSKREDIILCLKTGIISHLQLAETVIIVLWEIYSVKWQTLIYVMITDTALFM